MKTCDSATQPTFARVRKRNKMWSKNWLSFSTPVLTPLSPPPPQPQIFLKSRLGSHDVGNNCSMIIDGTDFCIPQKGITKKQHAFASHKYAGKSALTLWYELGVDIFAGNLVWIQGPYPAGKYTTIKILTRFCVASSSRVSGGSSLMRASTCGHTDKI